jgi:hypothetical protein
MRFEFLSVSTIEYSPSSEFDSFVLLSRSLGNRICHHSSLSVSPTSRNDQLLHINRSFVLTSKGAIEGIIFYLPSQHDGTVHDQGIINISPLDRDNTSSCYSLKNASDLTAARTYAYSKN